jgi:protein-tyrosine kinase
MPGKPYALKELEPGIAAPMRAVASRAADPETSEEPSRIAEELVSLLDPNSFAADQYRALRHHIEWLRRESGLNVLAVTSPAPGDGKTVTALNLAGALAQSPDARVLVVDADLRRPSVVSYLGFDPLRSSGLSDVLTDPAFSFTRSLIRLERFNLTVLPAGRPRPAPYELLNSSRLDALLTEVRGLYDFVLVDTPPIVSLPDCRLIGRSVDGFLLIVTAHKTPRKLVSEALNLLDPAKVVGVVFNGAERPRRHDGYYYYVHPSARERRWWHRD